MCIRDSPNYLHARVALDALRAGKHVMLDKPMATNARDGAKLVAEAKKRGLLFMVGQNLRFTPEVQTAKHILEKGTLGDVYHARTSWNRRAGIPRIGSWFTQKRYAGGGCTYDIGVHALDRCLYLMGEFDAAAVSGQTFAKFGPRGLGNGDWGKSEIDRNARFDVCLLYTSRRSAARGRARWSGARGPSASPFMCLRARSRLPAISPDWSRTRSTPRACRWPTHWRRRPPSSRLRWSGRCPANETTRRRPVAC